MSMIPKMPAPDLIGGGSRFSDKIMPNETSTRPKGGSCSSHPIMLERK